MNVQFAPVCPLLTRLSNFFKSSAEPIEYVCPACKVVTNDIAIAALAALFSISVIKELVARDFVVVEIFICDNIPPTTASSAYRPLSLSR